MFWAQCSCIFSLLCYPVAWFVIFHPNSFFSPLLWVLSTTGLLMNVFRATIMSSVLCSPWQGIYLMKWWPHCMSVCAESKSLLFLIGEFNIMHSKFTTVTKIALLSSSVFAKCIILNNLFVFDFKFQKNFTLFSYTHKNVGMSLHFKNQDRFWTILV